MWAPRWSLLTELEPHIWAGPKRYHQSAKICLSCLPPFFPTQPTKRHKLGCPPVCLLWPTQIFLNSWISSQHLILGNIMQKSRLAVSSELAVQPTNPRMLGCCFLPGSKGALHFAMNTVMSYLAHLAPSCYLHCHCRQASLRPFTGNTAKLSNKDAKAMPK